MAAKKGAITFIHPIFFFGRHSFLDSQLVILSEKNSLIKSLGNGMGGLGGPQTTLCKGEIIKMF